MSQVIDAPTEVKKGLRPILFVEDVRQSVEGLMVYLRARGLQVEFAEDLHSARRLLRQTHFGLLLIDWALPERLDAGAVIDDGGHRLINELLSGKLGQLNAQTPFAVITSPGRVGDIGSINSLPWFWGVHFKAGDIRPIMRIAERLAGPVSDSVARKPLRTLVRISGLKTIDGEKTALAVIPGWDRSQTLPLKLAELPETVRIILASESCPVFFTAIVNVAANRVDELQPMDFEFVEPIAEDDLE